MGTNSTTSSRIFRYNLNKAQTEEALKQNNDALRKDIAGIPCLMIAHSDFETDACEGIRNWLMSGEVMHTVEIYSDGSLNISVRRMGEVVAWIIVRPDYA